jgi:hypothetical protein
MGTWSTGTVQTSTDTTYEVGWLNYDGPQIVEAFFFDANTGVTDDQVTNLADELALANSATLLDGASSGAIKFVTSTTTTTYTYTPGA